MGSDAIFLDFSARKLEQQAGRIGVCLARLSPEQTWRRGAGGNAVGNLVLHLCGNLRQWMMSGVGGALDVRERDQEFATESGGDLAAGLSATVAEACAVIRGIGSDRLLEPIEVQGYRVTVLEAVYHVVEHFSGHAGQIFLLTREAIGAPLDFYSHLGSAHDERMP